MKKFINKYLGTLLAILFLCFFVIYCFNPFILYSFSRRPLFYHWVGASNTAWGLNWCVRDQKGTWLFFEDEEKIIVVLVTYDSSPQIPLLKSSPHTTIFEIDSTKYRVSDSDKNKIVLLISQAEPVRFDLNPKNYQEIREELFRIYLDTPEPRSKVLFHLQRLYKQKEQKKKLSKMCGMYTWNSK